MHKQQVKRASLCPGDEAFGIYPSKTNSSPYGAIMHFRTMEDLDNYKSKESGIYQTLVRSIREIWMDNTKPVDEQVFEILDI